MVEQRSRELHNDRFVTLNTEQQTAILKHMSEVESRAAERKAGRSSFLTFASGSSSPITHLKSGLREELNYKGKQVMGHWKGCQHPTGTAIPNKERGCRKRSTTCLVVGTGATGGMAAKVLTEHGLEVLLLESGTGG